MIRLLLVLGFVLTGCISVPPSQPRDVRALGGDRSATVSWTPPATQGSEVVLSYTITPSPDGIPSTASAQQTSARLDGLTNGRRYTFTVSAKTQRLESLPSEPSNEVVPQAPQPPDP